MPESSAPSPSPDDPSATVDDVVAALLASPRGVPRVDGAGAGDAYCVTVSVPLTGHDFGTREGLAALVGFEHELVHVVHATRVGSYDGGGAGLGMRDFVFYAPAPGPILGAIEQVAARWPLPEGASASAVRRVADDDGEAVQGDVDAPDEGILHRDIGPAAPFRRRSAN
jgi:hypothetical protein